MSADPLESMLKQQLEMAWADLRLLEKERDQAREEANRLEEERDEARKAYRELLRSPWLRHEMFDRYDWADEI